MPKKKQKAVHKRKHPLTPEKVEQGEVVVFRRDPGSREDRPAKWTYKDRNTTSSSEPVQAEFEDIQELYKEVADFGLTHAVSKEKKYMERKRLEGLGINTAKKTQRPYHIHMGMKRKQREREEKEKESEMLSGVRGSKSSTSLRVSQPADHSHESGGLRLLPGKLKGGTLHLDRGMIAASRGRGGRGRGGGGRGRGGGRGGGRGRGRGGRGRR